MPVSATTTLPDEDQPVLDNGIEDEITADRETQVTNNGSVRLQIRETGQSVWDSTAVGFAEQVVPFDDLNITFGGLEDGEEFELRARTETRYRTGTFTAPVAITTAFPTPSGLSATANSSTKVTLSWADQADNEDGFRVRRREQFSGGTTAFELLETLAPNTEQYVDDTAQPDRSYDYQVEAFTEDATASDQASATTPALGLETQPTDAQGWAVELERPDGAIRRPSVLDSAQIRPRLNARPEVRVPIRREDSWLDREWEEAEMRVWRDGERIPIEQLASIDPEPERTVLVGRGGEELTRRAELDVSDRSVHDVVEQLITDTTDYAVSVDAPPVSQQTLASVDSDREWLDVIGSVPDDRPATVTNSEVRLLQSNQIVAPREFGIVLNDASRNYTTSEVLAIGANESYSATIDLDYRVPADRLGVGMRVAYDNVSGAVEVKIDGTVVSSDNFASFTALSAGWEDKAIDSAVELAPGEHTVTVQLVDSDFDAASGTVRLDALSVYDSKYHSVGDYVNTLTTSGRLDGPPALYPDALDIEAQFGAIGRVTAIDIASAWSDTSNGQQLAASLDGGDSYPLTADNSETLSGSFGDDSGTVTVRLRVDRYSEVSTETIAETDIVRTGNKTQRVDSLSVEADALRTATVNDETIDGRLETVLSDLCNRANLLWEVQYDESVDGIRIVVARPGQRTSDIQPDLVDFAVTKSLDRRVSEAVIVGRSESVKTTFEVNINSTELPDAEIIPRSERVTQDGQTFERGDDYEINYLLGLIEAAAGSELAVGETAEIEYDARTKGEAFAVGNEFRHSVVEEVPEIATQQRAEEVADFIIEETAEPVFEAEITLPRQQLGYQLISAIDPDRLPAAGPLRVRELTETPEQVVLQLGLGSTAGDAINDIRSLLGSTARNV